MVAIEPTNARVHVGMPPAPHPIVGIGAGQSRTWCTPTPCTLLSALLIPCTTRVAGAGIVTHFFGLGGKALPEPKAIEGVIDECAPGPRTVYCHTVHFSLGALLFG